MYAIRSYYAQVIITPSEQPALQGFSAPSEAAPAPKHVEKSTKEGKGLFSRLFGWLGSLFTSQPEEPEEETKTAPRTRQNQRRRDNRNAPRKRNQPRKQEENISEPTNEEKPTQTRQRRPKADRITSYNVCYTKLLRMTLIAITIKAPVLPALIHAWAFP